MPSHADRVRRNYRCPVCEGEGRVDDYEGTYECYECGGQGVILVPKKPREATPSSVGALALSEGGLKAFRDNFAMSRAMLNSVYRPFREGDTIRVRLPQRFEAR